MRFSCIFSSFACLIAFSWHASAQSFSPVSLSGFNHDVVAESGSSSLTTTTAAMDGITVSNKVMYTQTFAATNGFGGGLPDNGIITDAAGSYQMAPYNASNALIIQRSQNADINLVTPASYSIIRLLCLSTEGTSLINISLFFTDGTVVNALSGYSLQDWFFNTNNLVLSGFGRCARSTPASGADAYPGNPRMYYVEIPISCANRQKLLQKINIANVTTAGTNAPYPNAIFFALSGKSASLNVSSGITNATCNSNGSASLTVSGSSPSFAISWNTNPPQSGSTASNLPAGDYTATITDAAGCVSTFPVTVGLDDNLFIGGQSDTTICAGTGFAPVISSNAASYSWSPSTGVSNTAIASPVLSPSGNTYYTVTGSLGPCSGSHSFNVNVTRVTLTVPSDTTICIGDSFTPSLVSNGTTFTWSPATGVSDPSSLNPVLSPTATTTFSVEAVLDGCADTASYVLTITDIQLSLQTDTSICFGASFVPAATGNAASYSWTPAAGVSNPGIRNPTLSPVSSATYTLTGSTGACSKSRSFRVNVRPPVSVNAGSNISIYAGQSVRLNGSGSSGSYSWTPAVGLSNPNALNPVAMPDATTTYTLTITTAAGCANSASVTVDVVPYCVKPLNAFSPNRDGINDTWFVTSGNCTRKISASVYNRYGSRVYESQDYHNDWDGTYRGNPLPDGTYYYVITYYLLNGKVETRRGDVTIIR